jgi:hypothetical protein
VTFLAHDPEKHALGRDPGAAPGFRGKIMRKQISADFAVLKRRRLR